MSHQAIRVRIQEPVCFLQLYRPEANNTISGRMVEECHEALASCGDSISIVVLEGLPDVFCYGADFRGMQEAGEHTDSGPTPELLYDLWLKLATGPYITVSHVRGKANAGGIGFIAASDIVLADQTATFSLSELLFGLFPACVLPFLIRRMGFQKAHYMTLATHPVSVQQAASWGLVDAYEDQSEPLLRRHLLRLRRLSKTAITRYKRYMNGLHASLTSSRSSAVAANLEVFSDPENLSGIFRYVESGLFPWEGT